MKSRITIAIIAIAASVGCSRNEPAYEIVRLDKGVIRLDKRTGEMVAVNEAHVPFAIDTAGLKEESEIDPALTVVKVFPDFRLPDAKKVITNKLQYRWIKGRMDYRITLSPYSEDLNTALRDTETTFTILLKDADGFEVQRFDAPLTTVVKLVGAGGKPEAWYREDSIAISKADFKRVVSMSYTWRYSVIPR